MAEFVYVRAGNIEEALEHLSDGEGKVLAGGTGLIIRLRQGKLRQRRVIDVNRIPALHSLSREKGRILVGAGVNFSELAASPLVRNYAAPLSQSASQVGSPQIRNMATLGGNIANGSPAADSVVPLLVLEADLFIRSSNGLAQKSISTLLEAKLGGVDIKPDELITAIEFQELPAGTRAIFLKSGRRNAMDISRLSLCALATSSLSGAIERLSIAVGAGGAFSFRLDGVEKLCLGAYPTAQLIEDTAEEIGNEVKQNLADCSTSAYKSQVVKGLARESLAYCFAIPVKGVNNHGCH